MSSRKLSSAFWADGLPAKISSRPGKKDLALFVSRRPARAAAVFTTNQVQAAPVTLSRRHVASGVAQAVVMNSGCANACTGSQGEADALATARQAAQALGVPVQSVLVASTGVIGHPLPMKKLSHGLSQLTDRYLQGEPPAFPRAVEAILTTDTRPKTVSYSWGGRYTLWGCAKGAGMIHPQLATMLSVLLTDAPLSAVDLRRALRPAAEKTFNCLTVDGDTSTNDSVFLLANGEGPSSPGLAKAFSQVLGEACDDLAQQIVADGEGATRTALIQVLGARSEGDARRMAATVATSPLVKTALHGADPNWGRILAALGRSGVTFDPRRVTVRLAGVEVCREGGTASFSQANVHRRLKKTQVDVEIVVGSGPGRAAYRTCDFSKEYVTINADYHT